MVNGFTSIFCPESLLVPFFQYAFVKLVVPIHENDNRLIVFGKFLYRIALMLIIFPIFMIILLMLICYFEIIRILAKIKFGASYHDVMEGADSMWTANAAESKSILHVMFLLENVPDTPEKLMSNFQDTQFQEKILKNHPRLSCLRKYYRGYSYYIKIKPDYSKIVQYFDNYNNVAEFNEDINRITESELPYDDEFLWQVVIGKRPIEVTPGKLTYPLIVRFHHSVGDGVALAMFMITCYTDNGMEIYKSMCDKFNGYFSSITQRPPGKPKDYFNLTTFIQKCKDVLNTYNEFYFHLDWLHHKEPENVLFRKLTGKKSVFYSFEKENDNLLNKIKQIKRALGVSFNDVVFGAVSAAFNEHYQKFDKCPPKNIVFANTFFLNVLELDKLVRFDQDGSPIVKLGNNFVGGMMELPVGESVLESSEELLQNFHVSSRRFRKSMDLLLCHWLAHCFGTISPKPWTLFACKKMEYTLSISNIPGPDMPLRCRPNCTFDGIVSWTNNFYNSGITLLMFTYKNMLSVGMNVDNGLIDNPKDIQTLCDNILYYINVLHEKTCKKSSVIR